MHIERENKNGGNISEIGQSYPYVGIVQGNKSGTRGENYTRK